jgi:hypothetical protein
MHNIKIVLGSPDYYEAVTWLDTAFKGEIVAKKRLAKENVIKQLPKSAGTTSGKRRRISSKVPKVSKKVASNIKQIVSSFDLKVMSEQIISHLNLKSKDNPVVKETLNQISEALFNYIEIGLMSDDDLEANENESEQSHSSSQVEPKAKVLKTSKVSFATDLSSAVTINRHTLSRSSSKLKRKANVTETDNSYENDDIQLPVTDSADMHVDNITSHSSSSSSSYNTTTTPTAIVSNVGDPGTTTAYAYTDADTAIPTHSTTTLTTALNPVATKSSV